MKLEGMFHDFPKPKFKAAVMSHYNRTKLVT